jgi:short-subunit dehydrogenase
MFLWQVIVGATAGIGASMAVKIAEYSTSPQIHLIGRNQQAADEVIQRLKSVNSAGQYEFHQCVLQLS